MRKKKNKNKESNSEESILPLSNREVEFESDYLSDDYVSLWNEIKELANDSKIWINNIVTPFNIIYYNTFIIYYSAKSIKAVYLKF